MDCPWCGVETRPTFAHCLVCGHDIHRRPPPPWVIAATTEPFGGPPDRSLHRRHHDGALWYVEPSGLLEAEVIGPRGRRSCRSIGGRELFALEPYEPGEAGSVTVVDREAGDRPLGTYVVEHSLPRVAVQVRDDAAAPVAMITGISISFRMIETGGAVVGMLERHPFMVDDNWVDDRWDLRVAYEPPTLDRRALLASLLVLHDLVSLPPHPPARAHERDSP